MKIKRAPYLMTALRKDYAWCGRCYASGYIYVGKEVVCPRCNGKGFKKVVLV